MEKQKLGGFMIKKIMFTVLGVLVAGIALASVNIKANGTNLGPAQDIDIIGTTPTGSGPVKTIDISTLSGTTLTSPVITSPTITGGDISGTVDMSGASINWQDLKAVGGVNWEDGNLILDDQKAASGTRYLIIDQYGNVTSSTTTPSGT